MCFNRKISSFLRQDQPNSSRQPQVLEEVLTTQVSSSFMALEEGEGGHSINFDCSSS
jgi:hypothetical protein